MLVAYRHGLRASELVTSTSPPGACLYAELRVEMPACIRYRRGKPPRRKLLREAPTSPYLFISERRAPLSVAGYQRMVARPGVAAKFTFLVHSHMLRHACGFKLARRLRHGSDGDRVRVLACLLRGFTLL